MPDFTAHSHVKYYECFEQYEYEDVGLHNKLTTLCRHAARDVYMFDV